MTTGPAHDPRDKAAPETAPFLARRRAHRARRGPIGPYRLTGPSGNSRGKTREARPPVAPKTSTRSPRIDSVAGRKVRVPTTDTNTTEMVPIAIDVKSETPRVMMNSQRDHHGQPGEEDGAPGGTARDLDRLLRPGRGRRAVRLGSGSVTEQRIVDRDGQPDEDDQLRCIRADGPDDLAVDAELTPKAATQLG